MVPSRAADRILGVAESSGMEVSEARTEQDQARDSLTKARVTIHSFQTELVEQNIQAGLKIAAKDSKPRAKQRWLSATVAEGVWAWLSYSS